MHSVFCHAVRGSTVWALQLDLQTHARKGSTAVRTWKQFILKILSCSPPSPPAEAQLEEMGQDTFRPRGARTRLEVDQEFQGETGQILGTETLWGLLTDKPHHTQEIPWAENSKRLRVYLEVADSLALSLLFLGILTWASVAVISFF